MNLHHDEAALSRQISSATAPKRDVDDILQRQPSKGVSRNSSFMSSELKEDPSPSLQHRSDSNPSNSKNPSATPIQLSLDASGDARALVRLLQCAHCSRPLQDPWTLPCGNSLCRTCVPDLHLRANISYPATTNRLQGFTCPSAECGQEHAAGDCSQDVTLSKVMEVVRTDIEAFRPAASETPILLVEQDKWIVAGVASLNERQPNSRVLNGGRLVSTYTMAEMGELGYDSEVSYVQVSGSSDDYKYLDVAVLEHLKEATRSELDCQVCYGLFLDPLTTNCGHTFCRKCLQRVLDHSNCCPICRRMLAVSPSLLPSAYPSNKRLSSLLTSICPGALAARAEASKLEDASRLGDLDTPLFICTLSFPSMPTFLHIFEPRYRLMIRRAIDSGERKFGMLLHNQRQDAQDHLGRVPFYQYGTLLHIVNMQLLPDGRSLIETVGVSRFRVLKHGVLDGYVVGQIERIDDVSLADEEAIEARETALAPSPHALGAQEHLDEPPQHQTSRQSQFDLDTMSTLHLMEISTQFVQRMKSASAPWLHSRVLQVHGECPADPALFPWWFASILPISEVEKYKLIGTTSVRARLKICADWVGRIEARRSNTPSSCTVL